MNATTCRPVTGTGFISRHSPWLIAVAGGVLYTLLAVASIEWSRGSATFAKVWLPNALAIAFMLRMRLSQPYLLLAALAVGSAVANTIGGSIPLQIGVFMIANTLEITIAVFVTRKVIGHRPDMKNIGDLARFAAIAGLIAPLASGGIIFISATSIGGPPPELAIKWMLTKSLAIILLAPNAMILAAALRSPRMPTRREMIEWTALLSATIAITTAVFAQSSYPLLFLIAPFVLAAAFRLGNLGTAVTTLIVAAIATYYTQAGSGPISLIDPELTSGAYTLQAFLASAFAIGLPVSAVLSGRARIAFDLADREAQLSLLASNVTDAILRYDLTGICTYASPSVRKVLAREPKDFIGQKASGELHEDAKETVEAGEHRLLSGESRAERLTYRRLRDGAEGKPVWIEADCAVAVHADTGTADGIIVSARDVTDRVELEQKLKRARNHAENAAQSKSQFLANMSHEIRTPMNGVLGFADMLLAGKLDQNQRRHAELIARSGRSMMMLLNDILDISKIEAGQIEIRHTPVDLPALLSDCINLQQGQVEQKGLSLVLSCARNLPQYILTDNLRVRQIVLNLLGNAVKFTEQGSVVLDARIVDQNDDSALVISVRDTGIGIAATRMESVFRSFEQADHTVTRRYGGTGLGLTISRELSGLLGGELVASSVEGEGSCFTLRLPFELADFVVPPQTKPAPSEAFHNVAEALASTGHILLAEDHDINRLLVTEMLERSGQDVAVVHDGNEAVDAVLDAISAGIPYDLVLMDIQMPDCDGYAATRRIRAAGITPNDLPIVALTANAFPEDIAAARDAGMQGHLSKPVAYRHLAATLQRWLPIRIVDTSRPGAPAMNKPELSETETACPYSPALLQKWHERRTQALDAVGAALREGEFTGDEQAHLARTVHKLAGTAGMFGEEELGRKACALERALKASVGYETRAKLAQELLDAA